MTTDTAQMNALALEIEHRAEDGLPSPFPYRDCRKLFTRKTRGLTEGFIPDLDYFSSSVYGYATSASSYIAWPRQRTEESLKCVGESFAEQHPEYGPLLREVNEAEYPNLFYSLSFYEQLRAMLLQLLSQFHSLEQPQLEA